MLDGRTPVYLVQPPKRLSSIQVAAAEGLVATVGS
jgi:hypothetical protein